VPNVDSVTVRVVPRAAPVVEDIDRFVALVDAGFAQRRKRLRNTLGALCYPPAAVEAGLDAIGRASGARAEELDLDTWVALQRALQAAV
jgi:16S rRNA (adenine1518-N6/adenine1519-N6)-dimethyltransferase